MISKSTSKRLLPILVWVARLLIGAVFMVSGLAKAIDIYGVVYKIEEYFTAWGITEPRSLVVMLAILLSGYEFVLGLMVAVGAYKRVAVWGLMAMMCVMLPLTAYIWAFNPVSDCGCFGDFIILSNAATFLKNVVIVGVLLFLMKYNTITKGVYHAYSQWMVVAVAIIYLLVVSIFGYTVQPMIDFRRFAEGVSLTTDNEAIADSYKYIYEKDEKRQAFSIDSLPDDSWTFVDRISEAEEIHAADDQLAIFDKSGDDVSADVLPSKGEQVLIVIPQVERADVSATYYINDIQQYFESNDNTIVELVGAGSDEAVDDWSDRSMATYPIYRADPLTLKELVRGDMGAVYLVDGVVKWKRTLGSIDVDRLDFTKKDVLQNLWIDGRGRFEKNTVMLFVALVVIYILDVSRKIFRVKRKKDAKSKNIE